MAVIAIDFDKTIVDEKSVPYPGAKVAIGHLRGLGHKVWIHSCNKPSWIQQTLNEYGIVVDGIWEKEGKPNADLYVDDKAYHFMGDWEKELKDIVWRVKGLDNRRTKGLTKAKV